MNDIVLHNLTFELDDSEFKTILNEVEVD